MSVYPLLEKLISPARLLLVEDDHAVGRIIRYWLDTQYVCQLTWAETGAAAMRAIEAEKEPFDMVLLNLLLPDMTGADVLRALKRRWDCVPVVVITGFSEAQVAREVLQIGVVAFFNKPFDSTALEHLFRTYKIAARTREDQAYFDEARRGLVSNGTQGLSDLPG